ncbi:MAG: isochorismatase family protein [Acidobacteriota bacterium]
MSHPNVLRGTDAALIVVDVQEAFRSVIGDFALIASRISIAIRGFMILGRPIIVTEQYPNGLGRTAEEIMLTLPGDFGFIEKTSFSSCGAAGLVESLTANSVDQVVLCGFEAHVCVNQTAHDLLDRGIAVHLLSDCTGSRFDHDRQTGMDKMFASGVVSSSVEMALFEMMKDSKHESFREIQALIK